MRNLAITVTLIFSALLARAELPHAQETPDEPEVFQREYIVAYRSQYPAVQTNGANPCVVIALYSRAEQKGYLAHIDFSVDIDLELERAGREFNWHGLEVSLAGGKPGDSLNLFERLKAKAQDLGGVIVAEEKNTDINANTSVRLDLETGVLAHYQEQYSSTPPEIAAGKIARLRFGTRLYRHQGSVGGGDPVEPREHSLNHFHSGGAPHEMRMSGPHGRDPGDFSYDAMGNEF